MQYDNASAGHDMRSADLKSELRSVELERDDAQVGLGQGGEGA